MQVTVETTQGLERRMTITVDNTQVEGEIEKRIRQLAKTQRIDGFRPGKVPASVIRRRFGTAVRQEVAGELMQRNFIEAIIAEKINPAGAPRFEELPVEGESQDFAFAATFEVYPELELKGVEEIVVEKPVASVTDADLDNMIDTLRKQQASWEVAERAAEANDRVTIDFDGSVDGEAFEGGKAENFALEMGAGRMIPGFEDGIVGKNAGEAFDIDVTFPEDYHAENLKGKAAKFAIKLHKVEGRVLPEVDEAFAKRFGVEDGSVEGLRSEIRKNMERELEQAVKNNIKNQVIDGLLKANDIDLPRALVDQEIDTLRQQAMSRFGDMGGQNQPELPAELFEDQARKRVQVGLVLGEVIKAHELKVEDDRVQALIANMASAYEDPQEVIDHYNSNQELLQQIRNLALEDQAIDSVLDKAQVSEKATAFDDLMNPAANA